SSVGYESQLVSLGTLKGNNLLIQLVPSQHTIDEVQIVVNTGYQRVIKERSTGSFSHIDNNLLNRSGSSDIFKRIENLVPGILFNHGDAANTDSFLIRGRSTIAADAQPLIIIDDFPYDGDMSNINPDDVESVTILKDAAAASIWGARAGNGVVVITTKKGTSGKTHVNFASRLMATSRPDLSTSNLISSEARIDLEKFLFENGRYNAAKNPISLTNRTTAIPEAVELMILDPVDLDDRLANMAKHNVLEEIEENMYRPAVNQQYTFNVNGGQDRLQYFFSGGLDHNRSSLVGEHKQRITLRSSNKYLISENLHVDFGLSLSEELSKNGKNEGLNTAATSQFSLSPYSQLLDNEGNSLPVYIPRRKGFVDTVGN